MYNIHSMSYQTLACVIFMFTYTSIALGGGGNGLTTVTDSVAAKKANVGELRQPLMHMANWSNAP